MAAKVEHEDVVKLGEHKESLERRVEALAKEKRKLEGDLLDLKDRREKLIADIKEQTEEMGKRKEAERLRIEKAREEIEKEKASCHKERQAVNADAEKNQRRALELERMIEKADKSARDAQSALDSYQHKLAELGK